MAAAADFLFLFLPHDCVHLHEPALFLSLFLLLYLLRSFCHSASIFIALFLSLISLSFIMEQRSSYFLFSAEAPIYNYQHFPFLLFFKLYFFYLSFLFLSFSSLFTFIQPHFSSSCTAAQFIFLSLSLAVCLTLSFSDEGSQADTRQRPWL